MSTEDPKQHWEGIYTTKLSTELSWYQEHPRCSLDLIRQTGAPPTARILDVGGGDSTLVDHLVEGGYRNVTVLDLSGAALRRARGRLGQNAGLAKWREADILIAELSPGSVDVWHDRAVFHFLSVPEHRAAYIKQVRNAVQPGGHVIVATFAENGPSQCSGLAVERYSAASLHATLGDHFRLVATLREVHRTPSGTKQRFTYCYCMYEPVASVVA